MVAPLVLLAGLGAVAALAFGGSGGSDSSQAPGIVDSKDLPPGTQAALKSGSTDPLYYYNGALIAYQTGDEKSAKALLSVCNYYLQQRGKPPMAYPPTPAGALQLQGSPALPGPVTPGSPGTQPGPAPTPQTPGLPPGVPPVVPPAGMPGLFGLPVNLPPGFTLPGTTTPANVPAPSGGPPQVPPPGVTPPPPTVPPLPSGQPATQPASTQPPPSPLPTFSFPTGFPSGVPTSVPAGFPTGLPTGTPGGASGLPVGAWNTPAGNTHYVLQDKDYGIVPVAQSFGKSATEAHAILALNPGAPWGTNNIHPGDDIQVPNEWVSNHSPTGAPSGRAYSGKTFASDGVSPSTAPATSAPTGTAPTGWGSIFAPFGGGSAPAPPAGTSIPAGTTIPASFPTGLPTGAPTTKPLPTGAYMENGSLYYKLQSGDYGAAQISQKFGHGSEFQALMALNPGFPWGTAPVGAKLNVPVAWAYA